MAAIVEILGLIAVPAVELGKCFAGPIKGRYNYLRHFDSNIRELKETERNLKDVREGLQMRVDTAKDNAEEILPEVNTWFKDVDKIQEKMTIIDREITEIQSGCFAVKSRLSLSKKAEDTAGAMRELQDRCRNFNRISNPAPPPATALPPLGSTYDFQSRKDIEEDVVKFLKKFNMVGICGMGGVGKTTTAERVRNRMKGEGLFDETVMVVVSQNMDILKIQNEMAGSLGLKLEEEGSEYRKFRLHTRLTEGNKRILIILDDVWEYFELQKLGIPCEKGLQGCKILLTSRDRDVLHRMDVQICEIHNLSENEAWPFFKEKVGNCVDDQHLLLIAQEVAKQCKGLPIALVNVAMALKGKEDKLIWENARRKLESSNPRSLPLILDKVYKPLKLSYDSLDSEVVKSLFLLCCLFPEDHNIPLDYLTAYAWGLGVFERIQNLEEARMETYSLIDKLKSRFLLLEGPNKNHVKMHDVIRDVSIFIASEEMRIRCDDCTWISAFVKIELSSRSSFPKLRLLLIDESTQVNGNFFEEKRELHVFSVMYRRRMGTGSPPLARIIQSQKNLRTLLLEYCQFETISVVGELVNLEIFILNHCQSIKELPVEIGRLNRLRRLDISYCWDFKTIVPGIISRLVNLEELKMVASFKKWESENNEGKQRKNVALRELESLRNLTCLEIEVDDPAVAAEQISLSQKIVKFDVTIGNCRCWRFKSDGGSENKMCVHLGGEITLGNWILKFLRDSKCMGFEGEVTNLELNQTLQNKRSLTLTGCSTVKKLMNTSTAASIFSTTSSTGCENNQNSSRGINHDHDGDSLHLFNEPKKVAFGSHQIPTGYFTRLEKLMVTGCDKIRYLFSSSIAHNLTNLRELKVGHCLEMVIVIGEEHEEERDASCDETICLFPKLETLHLTSLWHLKSFCEWKCVLKLSSLKDVRIENCPEMERFTLGSLATPKLENICFKLKNESSYKWDAKPMGMDIMDFGADLSFMNAIRLLNQGKHDSVFRGPWDLRFSSVQFEQRMHLHLPREITLQNWIHQYAKSVVYLLLEGDGSDNFDLGQAQNMRLLIYRGSSTVKKCVNITSSINDGRSGTATDIFPLVEHLELQELGKLEEICNIDGSISDEGSTSNTAFKFPKLKVLILQDLPNLTTFCKGIESIEFPLLIEMRIINLPNLKSLVPTTCSIRCKNNQNSSGGNNHDHDDNDDCLHLLCTPEKVACGSYQIPSDSFTRLEKLRVMGCDKIGSLFSSSVAQNLINLRELKISHCPEMVKVIGEDQEKEKEKNASCGETICLFHKLETLHLISLQHLKSFCEWKCALELPSLKDLKVESCPKIERFTRGSLTTPKMENICSHLREYESSYKWDAKLKGMNIMSSDAGGDDYSFMNAIRSLNPQDCSFGSKHISSALNRGKHDIFGVPQDFRFSPVSLEKRMHLHLQREITLENWIHQYIRSVVYMLLEGAGSNNFDLGQAQNMRLLIFRGCSTVKKLVNITSSIDDRRCGTITDMFPLLEHLELQELGNFEEICNIAGSILDERSTSNIAFKFPKLKVLILRDLPNFTTFCKGIESIEFPLLTDMRIVNLPNLRSVVPTTCSIRCKNNQNNSGGNNHDYDDNDDSLHLLCTPQKVAFGSYQIPSDAFTRLEKLRVTGCDKIRSLFSSSVAQNLINLRELEISHCLEMVKVIGEDQEKEKEKNASCGETICLFHKLETLHLISLQHFKSFCEWKCALELPSLKELKIKNCPKIERFTRGYLTTPKLENICIHLKEDKSSYKWDAELEGMNSMSCYAGVDDYSFMKAIHSLNPQDFRGKHDISGVPEKRMHLYLPREITLENWIHKYVWSVVYMLLEGEGSNNWDLGQAQNMRLLIFRGCSTVKKLVPSSIDDGRCGSTTVFPRLEYLGLENLANLEEICDINCSISANFFKNLKELRLECLPALKHLLANDWFLQLERLEIVKCEMMEQIFLRHKEENRKDIGHESHHVTFSKLKSLRLNNLTNLITFRKRIEKIKFPLLTQMFIQNCPNLRSFVSTVTSSGCGNSQKNLGGINHDDYVDDDTLHWFCTPDKVALGSLNELMIHGCKNISILWCHQIPTDFFTKLESLFIDECGGINSLFSSSTTGYLVNLRSLTIRSCEKMVKVIEDDNKEKDACGDGEKTHCLFPKLKTLNLINLPNLKSFCQWSCALVLPSLDYLFIQKCPQMEKFSLGSLTAPNLKAIHGDDQWRYVYLIIKTGEDLNGALQRCLFEANEREEKKREEKKKMKEEEKKKKKEGEGEKREEMEEEESEWVKAFLELHNKKVN